MPGAFLRTRPASASEVAVSDEASRLELHLQRQLEEDVARIFDESIYSDTEVVCGKLKILTHSCILKARTKKFYHKLESILHVNIGRNTFDEIYSFISDAYTECNIKYQEKEIIAYLENHLNVKSNPQNNLNIKTDTEESDVFLTPKCGTPYVEKVLPKSISASPSTDLTKEYYALVPIEKNVLEKELIEQDALSNAFHSIIKSQTVDLSKIQFLERNKPTSLSLTSSHISKPVKHSNSCDILNNLLRDNSFSQNSKSVEKIVTFSSHNLKDDRTLVLPENNNERDRFSYSDLASTQSANIILSPDSLITDDPSSSSDYLSAAYTFSPELGAFGGLSQLNVGDSTTKMENTVTSSDSGLENTGLLESISSHKDITLTDVSLTESTLHDLTVDDTNDSVSSSFGDKNLCQRLKCANQAAVSTTSSEKDFNSPTLNQLPKVKEISRKSSKEEKQRQNEEIVILESSSLSSETGSWESVFPPKIAEKQLCEHFISNERQFFNQKYKEKNKASLDSAENVGPSLIQKSPFKSTSCFIDAASLVDEQDDSIKVETDVNILHRQARSDALPAPSQPMPCSTSKFDVSPGDWSESNENDDSLEQADNKDPDSIQKDLSPTIFEMTPITEDSLCTNPFENIARVEDNQLKGAEIEENPNCTSGKESSHSSNTILVSSTPHNSIMSLKVSALKQYESDESDTTRAGIEGHMNIKKNSLKYNESSPIVSGGASIEDHLPQMTSHSGSPLARRKIENMPIVPGVYVPQMEENYKKKSPKPSNASAWIVDMTHSPKSDPEKSGSSTGFKRPGDRTCELLRNGSKSSLDSFNSMENNKSRSSVDSDGSEKSSHKFYIDLASLPDPIPPKTNECAKSIEKKNIFSMFIDLGEKPAKEMPARLSSSHTKKNPAEVKYTPKSTKNGKNLSEVSAANTSGTDGYETFEKYESLCNDPNINISEILNICEKKSSSKTVSSSHEHFVHSTKHSEGISAEQQRNTSKDFKEERFSEQTADLFVRLSDLDKPGLKTESIIEEKMLDVRMTRSIPENTWGEKNHAGTSRSIEVISSFHSENALSLNRLFPHLKNEFSRSMPGSLSGRTRSPMRMGVLVSPGDLEEQAVDVSELSSVQSSICRSVIENSTTEDSQTSSLIGNCQSRLGQDLLRMFLQEIAPDVVVEVSGRRIKAHKCILSSRCQYFAGILSGGWVESAGNVIILPPFSYNVVHFALCHIYSGLSTIPDTISIVELATIADMLGLEGLKEAIMFTLKAKYCHHFHRPCQVCTAGVLECFPLSSVYGLDDLYRKCLKWITKYFSKVWPTKPFATLPKELLDKCYQQHITNLTIDNLVDTVYGCGITVASLQNNRWSESVARMCRRLESAAAHFAAPRLLAVLRALAPLPADAPEPAEVALSDCLSAAIEWAPPDEACRSYAYLSTVVKEIRTNKPSSYNNLLHAHAFSWRLQCEGALVRAAPRVVGTQAFKDLPQDLRKRLRELGCIMYGATSAPAPMSSTLTPDRKTHSSNISKNKMNAKSVTQSLDIDHVRASFVPYAAKPAVNLGSIEVLKSNNDIRDMKKSKGTIPPKIRTTKAQEERARFNLSKNNQSQDRLSVKTVPGRMPFENTKPRYLEPKIPKKPEQRTVIGKKLVAKMISSSESSRNSSPVQARNARTSRGKSWQVNEAPAPAMSQDSLATSSRPRTAEPSTESLSESHNSNKYATYTKIKHTKGSVESVTSSKCQTTLQASKAKTKIPVYLNQSTKLGNGDVKTGSQKRCTQSGKSVLESRTSSEQVRDRSGSERKVPGSLMNATKSSSAKIVPKIVKAPTAKSCPKSKRPEKPKHIDQENSPEISVMDRSGTFLKDEPTFGDKTTNIDIYLDQ